MIPTNYIIFQHHSPCLSCKLNTLYSLSKPSPMDLHTKLNHQFRLKLEIQLPEWKNNEIY